MQKDSREKGTDMHDKIVQIQEEVKKAIENGFEPISLGRSRLRTETAALVACHILNLQNQ